MPGQRVAVAWCSRIRSRLVSESAVGEQEPDKGSVGLLAQVFPREVVGAAMGRAGVKELRDRVLPARLMVYFVIGMWLWSGIGYIRVLKKVTAGLRWTAADGDRCPLPYDGPSPRRGPGWGRR